MKQVGEKERRQLIITGAVQGVGFRPFVYRLARELRLSGWVENSPRGVVVESEGSSHQLGEFTRRLRSDKPAAAFIQNIAVTMVEARNNGGAFTIRQSSLEDEKTASIIPDLATCQNCLAEIFNPGNRRYLYPFTNCTHCGPRYSIIEALPYDRSRTTMKGFVMCAACREEYENPDDRRFYAQPNACPECGPQLALWDHGGNEIGRRHQALLKTAAALEDGKIVAVKGLGGFHLMVEADNDRAVRELRRRKNREEKPLAVMFPDMASIRDVVEVSEVEEELLLSPAAPIVLIMKKAGNAALSEMIAPGNPYLGVFLPYTPLHHLLLHFLKRPAVATSGNLSEEPICIDEKKVVSYLGAIADFFLVHDRPVTRHVDDSVVKVISGKPVILRRARGYAPSPVTVADAPSHTLAVGAHLKNTVAVTSGNNVYVSQHIGDLETSAAYEAFEEAIDHFNKLYEEPPEVIACDRHPDYLSSRYAEKLTSRVVRVQHHYAHILSVMAENKIAPPVLGVAWDGTGYGDDGTVWGGEFLTIDKRTYIRSAHLQTFPLPGGDRAVREPRRSAIGLLYQLLGDDVFAVEELPPPAHFTPNELRVIKQMLRQRINCPLTSSVGRLFDAVASLLDIRQICTFEGQAAMELESLTYMCENQEIYDIQLVNTPSENPLISDWRPMIRQILTDINSDVSREVIATKFHNTLADVIVHIAIRIGIRQVALSGGCFQNKYLTETAVKRLSSAGFETFTHELVPPNDGGIALGQVMAVKRELEEQ